MPEYRNGVLSDSEVVITTRSSAAWGQSDRPSWPGGVAEGRGGCSRNYWNNHPVCASRSLPLLARRGDRSRQPEWLRNLSCARFLRSLHLCLALHTLQLLFRPEHEEVLIQTFSNRIHFRLQTIEVFMQARPNHRAHPHVFQF